MLAITLNPGEFVEVGKDIKVYARGRYITKIAIDAPDDVSIRRGLPTKEQQSGKQEAKEKDPNGIGR